MNIGIAITKNELKFEKLTSKIKKTYSDFNFIKLDNEEKIIDNIENIDILLSYNIPKKIFKKKIGNLKWIQLGNAGVDNCMYDEVIKSKIIITNSRGINSIPVAEYVMSAILFFSKNLNKCIEFKNNKIWSQWEIAKTNETLENKILGIIGYGSIGKEIAKRAKKFNMKIYATRRLQKNRLSNKNVDLLLPLCEIDYLLNHSDYIVIACPLTYLTRNLINKKKFNIMNSNSILINVSRGEIIDEKELINVLINKKIKGAALDVFNLEPLSKDSPLFNLNNVLLSPHIAGNFNNYQSNVIKAFEENLNRYINHKSLRNRVCKKRQY